VPQDKKSVFNNRHRGESSGDFSAQGGEKGKDTADFTVDVFSSRVLYYNVTGDFMKATSERSGEVVSRCGGGEIFGKKGGGTKETHCLKRPRSQNEACLHQAGNGAKTEKVLNASYFQI